MSHVKWSPCRECAVPSQNRGTNVPAASTVIASLTVIHVCPVMVVQLRSVARALDTVVTATVVPPVRTAAPAANAVAVAVLPSKSTEMPRRSSWRI